MSEIRAALYMRLSREDKRLAAESESISNQRLFLMQYAESAGIPVLAEYADDGISGTKWERNGLQEMLDAIEHGFINTVLVKDLSRLSRDYLRTGELLEQWFPMHGVRLIAVSDCVDTAAHAAGNDYSPIRAVMDDWYARDISRKVRAAIYARQDAGICTAASLPYGYFRSEGEICVDTERARIVNEIFRIYIQKKALHAPADVLNHAGIPSPRCGRNGWSTAAVRRILSNSAYCGRLAIRVSGKASYKSTKRIVFPVQAHIIIPVPRIVPEKLFRKAAQILCEKAHTAVHAQWISGLVTCGECGSRFVISDGRLRCGGRRRGNGCICRSVSLAELTAQITDAVAMHGFPRDPALLPLLVNRILISCTQMTVFVRYRKPTVTEHTGMYNITK